MSAEQPDGGTRQEGTPQRQRSLFDMQRMESMHSASPTSTSASPKRLSGASPKRGSRSTRGSLSEGPPSFIAQHRTLAVGTDFDDVETRQLIEASKDVVIAKAVTTACIEVQTTPRLPKLLAPKPSWDGACNDRYEMKARSGPPAVGAASAVAPTAKAASAKRKKPKQHAKEMLPELPSKKVLLAPALRNHCRSVNARDSVEAHTSKGRAGPRVVIVYDLPKGQKGGRGATGDDPALSGIAAEEDELCSNFSIHTDELSEGEPNALPPGYEDLAEEGSHTKADQQAPAPVEAIDWSTRAKSVDLRRGKGALVPRHAATPDPSNSEQHAVKVDMMKKLYFSGGRDLLQKLSLTELHHLQDFVAGKADATSTLPTTIDSLIKDTHGLTQSRQRLSEKLHKKQKKKRVESF